MVSICAKLQLNEDSLTPIKYVHTKLIHLQMIWVIGHERNRCLYSIEQKKHIPLTIFLLFNTSSNGKAPIITLQMNTRPICKQMITYHRPSTFDMTLESMAFHQLVSIVMLPSTSIKYGIIFVWGCTNIKWEGKPTSYHMCHDTMT